MNLFFHILINYVLIELDLLMLIQLEQCYMYSNVLLLIDDYEFLFDYVQFLLIQIELILQILIITILKI